MPGLRRAEVKRVAENMGLWIGMSDDFKTSLPIDKIVMTYCLPDVIIFLHIVLQK